MEKLRESQFVDLDVIPTKKTKIRPGVEHFDENRKTDDREDDPPCPGRFKVLKPGGCPVPKKRRPVRQSGYVPGISSKKWDSLRHYKAKEDQQIKAKQRIRDRMDSDPESGCNIIYPAPGYQDEQDQGYENQNHGVTKIGWKAENEGSTQINAALPKLYSFFWF
jgi:hypothetical protein